MRSLSEQAAYLAAWDKYHESEPRAGDTIGEHWAFEAAFFAALKYRQEELAALTAERDEFLVRLNEYIAYVNQEEAAHKAENDRLRADVERLSSLNAQLETEVAYQQRALNQNQL